MNFLFLCTGNSCRSILSEALFNHRAATGWKAYSAGSKPTGTVHPLTLKALQKQGLKTEHLFSKSLQSCQNYAIDIVISVCDDAAKEPCPIYLGPAIKAHWGLTDPSHLILAENQKLLAFEQCIKQINRRFDALLALDIATLSRSELIIEINKIADIR